MQSDAMFEKYGHLITKYGPEFVKKVGYVYQFEVAPAKGYGSRLSLDRNQQSGHWISRTGMGRSRRGRKGNLM